MSRLRRGQRHIRCYSITTKRPPHTLYRTSATVRKILIQLLPQDGVLLSEERDGCARLPGPTCPAHSVHIGLHAAKR